jgi:hypothetical protein
VGDDGIPVGQLSGDRQELPGFAGAVSEVAVGECQCRDAGFGEAFGEGVQAHFPRRAQAVPQDHDRWFGHPGGQVEPACAGVRA